MMVRVKRVMGNPRRSNQPRVEWIKRRYCVRTVGLTLCCICAGRSGQSAISRLSAMLRTTQTATRTRIANVVDEEQIN